MSSKYNHIDSMWLDVVSDLVMRPVIHSRGGDCREIIGWSGTLENTQGSFLTNPRRALDPAYAAAEFIWYMRRDDDIKMIKEYAPQYEKFAEANGKAFGAYGKRLDDGTRWDLLWLAEKLLRDDAESRQCVISIFTPFDLRIVTTAGEAKPKDIPCTLTWQFILRDGLLHMVTSMRSNDVWLGFPYDVFVNTCIQRMLANQLGWEPGTYTHHVGSMHLYEKHRPALLEALTTFGSGADHDWTQPTTVNDIAKLIECEEEERQYAQSWGEDCTNTPFHKCSMAADLIHCVRSHKVDCMINPIHSPALAQGVQNHVNHRRNRLNRQDDVVS